MIASFSNYEDPEFVDWVASAILPLADPITPAFAREWQLSTLAREMAPDHLDTVVSETLKVPARVWRDTFDGFLKTPDFTSELKKVSAPALLVWGEHDAYVRRAAQDRLLEVIPGARLLAYEGTGHALHWEEPARFANDLVTFVSENLVRASGKLGSSALPSS